MKWLVFDPKPAEGSLVPTDFQEVSFLQYTSGSTSEPKGVVITHSCLWSNLELILQEVKADETTVVVSWLPQYHDMGLIGSYLGTAACGGCGYYTSPLNFVKRPSTWVEAISEFKGTHMQAPNFAFALVVRKFEDCELDLSCARHIINGAEPIEAQVIDAFYDKFKPYGLKEVVFPTYGLAEHTVLVCTNGRDRVYLDPKALEEKRLVESPEGRCFVGCGKPVDVKIDGEIGEILLKSSSVAKGYWGGDTFGEYLATGDEGFVRNGELFICGRLKDLIILRGKNHYPQDVEHTVERNPNVRAGCVAAFGHDDHLFVVAEVREHTNALARELGEEINNEHGLK
ncbi:MAG: AMP-binding protein, partial [Myxococcota bacterium]